MINKMKKTWIIIGILIIVVGIFILASGKSGTPKDSKITGAYIDVLKESPVNITIYKTPQCGCCGVYINYLQKRTTSKINIEELPDITSIKDKYNITDSMRSCHTSIINGYVVEGHIPAEAINKLLTDKLDILGIAMPGMPSGSPGMPGQKRGEFIIYSLNKDGSTTEFMRL